MILLLYLYILIAKKHLNELLHKEDHIKVAPVVAMVQKPGIIHLKFQF